MDKRVADLVGRMNMEEKVNQLVLPFGAKFPADYQSFNTSGLGGTYPLAALPGQTWIETRNAWQRHAVENTRLGIPTSFIAETLHSGYAGGTNFPMPCLQGSTWNRPMVQEVAAVIGKEAAASGIDRGFSPVLHFCTVRPAGRAALPPCSPCGTCLTACPSAGAGPAVWQMRGELRRVSTLAYLSGRCGSSLRPGLAARAGTRC